RGLAPLSLHDALPICSIAHGQSDRQRSPGSIGACKTPGRVNKGHRMAGRLGGDKVTVQTLKVVMVDPERNLLAVRGAVPGGDHEIGRAHLNSSHVKIS